MMAIFLPLDHINLWSKPSLQLWRKNIGIHFLCFLQCHHTLVKVVRVIELCWMHGRGERGRLHGERGDCQFLWHHMHVLLHFLCCHNILHLILKLRAPIHVVISPKGMIN
jgi:hypothetical protein